MNASENQTLAESPWFWVHVFSVFTIIVLMLSANKIESLSSARARNAAMRRSVYYRSDDSSATGEIDSPRNNWLLPSFYLFFGTTAIVSWIQVWRTVLRHRLAEPEESENRDKRQKEEG